MTANFDLATLNGSNGFVIDGIEPGDNLGSSLSGAGDINGDGIADLIIGAPGGQADNPNTTLAIGESFVVFGGSNVGSSGSFDLATLNGNNGFVINGIDGLDLAGAAVSSAGDINNDGLDDLIIGAPDADPFPFAGESYVVFGSNQGFSSSLNLATLNGSNGFVLNGPSNNDRSGTAVSDAGDVNGDGIADLMIGAPEASPGGRSSAGESYVVFGGSGIGSSGSFELASLNGNNGFVINGIEAFGDRAGAAVSSAGDVNGDGLADLVIGAPRAAVNGQSNAGESYVVFGRTGIGSSGSLDLANLNGTTGFVINGIDSDDSAGGAVSNVGDLNGDGFDDLVIAAASADPNGNSAAGESYVVFGGSGVGNSGSLNLADLNGTNGFVINGISAFDGWGNSVSGAGDVNNDGLDDLIVGSNNANGSYVIFGSSGLGSGGNLNLADISSTAGTLISTDTPSSFTGRAVSGIGDVNGDGIDDLMTANPNAGGQAGRSYIVFGGDNFAPAASGGSSNGGSAGGGSNGGAPNGGSSGGASGGASSSLSGGFFNFQQWVELQQLDDGITVPFTPVEVGRVSLASLFDETDYLSHNADVQAAVANGTLTSGYDHFVNSGQFEGRNPSVLYNEAFYLSQNLDVAAAVDAGVFRSGFEHYISFGHIENRVASSVFDANDYLTNNPDVAGAVAQGAFASGFEHFVEFGADEGRIDDLMLFEEVTYLTQNPDVAQAVAQGAIASGLAHYVTFGQREGRNPSDLFQESSYLAANPDVASAVGSGAFSSGFEHYVEFGRAEGRLGA